MTEQSRSPHQRFPIGILLVGITLLLPTLSFPMGPDHAAFLRGGLSMFEGGTLYVDFIDVKPPLIYQLFGSAAWLFGLSEQSVRWLDLIWQSATLIALLWVLQGAGARRSWQWASTIVYTMLYANLNFSQTAQVESYAGLPLLLITGLWLRGHSVGRDTLIGACFALLFLLKYTFVGVFVVFIAFDFLHVREHTRTVSSGVRDIGKRMLVIFLSSTLVAFVLLLPVIFKPGFLDGWKTVLSYLSVYASNPPVSVDLIRAAIKSMGVEAGDFISLAVSAAAIAGIVSILNRTIDDKYRILLEVSALAAVGLLLTVLIERKFPPYHYSRMYTPIAILSGYGIAYAIDYVRQRIQGSGVRTAVTVAVILLIGAVLSPLPRYVNLAAVAVKSLDNDNAYDVYLTRADGGGMNFTTFRKLQHWLNARVRTTDNVMFMTLEASMIIPFVHTAHHSGFADSHLYFGVGVPESWHLRAFQQLQHADWLVVDTADRSTVVNIHSRTSMQSLVADTLLGTEFRHSFVLADSIDVFRIYQRTSEH